MRHTWVSLWDQQKKMLFDRGQKRTTNEHTIFCAQKIRICAYFTFKKQKIVHFGKMFLGGLAYAKRKKFKFSEGGGWAETRVRGKTNSPKD